MINCSYTTKNYSLDNLIKSFLLAYMYSSGMATPIKNDYYLTPLYINLTQYTMLLNYSVVIPKKDASETR